MDLILANRATNQMMFQIMHMITLIPIHFPNIWRQVQHLITYIIRDSVRNNRKKMLKIYRKLPVYCVPKHYHPNNLMPMYKKRYFQMLCPIVKQITELMLLWNEVIQRLNSTVILRCKKSFVQVQQ